MYGTLCSLPGSYTAIRFIMSGIEVLQIRQLRLVQLLEHARLDLALQKRRRRHDDVVVRVPRQQLGLEHLVGVEHVVVDLDAGLLR